MRIALYDVDSKIPNLALMKLSAYHKERGDSIEWYMPLMRDHYDKIYASKVFAYSDGDLDPSRMEIGGTGWSLTKTLPLEIERLRPDCSLYEFRHSMGFTMRGCRLNCPFCVVPQKEGKPQATATIDEIWTQRDSDFVILLDNDFFGNPQWANRITEIQKHSLRVNFSQGLNIRLITDEQAKALASVRFRNLSNKKNQVHFAWDNFRQERMIRAGIERCLEAGLMPWQMAFYVLVGYDSTEEDDLHRITVLRDYGCDPYVMPYYSTDPYQRRLARWTNYKAIFKSVPWGEYRVGIKRKHLTVRATGPCLYDDRSEAEREVAEKAEES